MNSVELIPIFEDNYVFLITNPAWHTAILVDPGDASAAVQILEQRNLTLVGILITHHHDDHIAGLSELIEKFKVPVYAPERNRMQIPQADHFVHDGDQFQIDRFLVQVLGLPGHTLGHVAYWFADQEWLFSGDVLFGLGCGRLFEGTPEQMFLSLQKIKALPRMTKIFCAHEYTETNLKFFNQLRLEPAWDQLVEIKNLISYESDLRMKRAQAQPSVPLILETEKKTNPFLCAIDVEQFAKLRSLRNEF